MRQFCDTPFSIRNIKGLCVLSLCSKFQLKRIAARAIGTDANTGPSRLMAVLEKMVQTCSARSVFDEIKFLEKNIDFVTDKNFLHNLNLLSARRATQVCSFVQQGEIDRRWCSCRCASEARARTSGTHVLHVQHTTAHAATKFEIVAMARSRARVGDRRSPLLAVRCISVLHRAPVAGRAAHTGAGAAFLLHGAGNRQQLGC